MSDPRVLHVAFSGIADDPSQHGVGLKLRKNWGEYLLLGEWTGVGCSRA